MIPISLQKHSVLIALQMHTSKRRRITEKIVYSDLIVLAVVQTPPRQHQKSSFSNSNASKKETI
jgi:hypothetical protein